MSEPIIESLKSYTLTALVLLGAVSGAWAAAALVELLERIA